MVAVLFKKERYREGKRKGVGWAFFQGQMGLREKTRKTTWGTGVYPSKETAGGLNPGMMVRPQYRMNKAFRLPVHEVYLPKRGGREKA